MLKCWSCQSWLFCGGNASKVFARYKAALVSEIIIAFQSASKCFAGTAQKLSVLAFSFRCEFLLFVLDVFRFSPTLLYLGGTCLKRTGFNAISVCSILALWKFSDALPFLHGLMEFLLAFLYLLKLKTMIDLDLLCAFVRGVTTPLWRMEELRWRWSWFIHEIPLGKRCEPVHLFWCLQRLRTLFFL